jgi:hypothetical protein
MVSCVVAWSFVLFQDTNLLKLNIMFSSCQVTLISKDLKFHVVTSSLAFDFKTYYEHINYCVFTFANLKIFCQLGNVALKISEQFRNSFCSISCIFY